MVENLDDGGEAFFRGLLIALLLSLVLIGLPTLSFFWGRASASCDAEIASHRLDLVTTPLIPGPGLLRVDALDGA